MNLMQFPLARSEFVQRYGVRDRDFDLDEALVHSELGNGDVLTADYGPRLWRGRYEFSRLTHARGEALKARISALQYAGRTFEAYDPVNWAPASDRDGSVLGAAMPTVLDVEGSNRRLRLGGLPSGYVLSEGDRLSTVSSANGAVSLHRVVSETVNATGAGATTFFEVVPHILPHVQMGDPVTLIRPYCLAQIVPKSLIRGALSKLHVSGVGFEFVQKVVP